ncbi:MAG: hypothetical protein ABIA37_05565 [Candidatus Woesearchaeota archaeon]
MQGGVQMNMAYDLNVQRGLEFDYFKNIERSKINLLVIDERKKERAKEEIDYCTALFNPFRGYTINYNLVNSFADAEKLVGEDITKFFAAITWIRENTLEQAVGFAFFQQNKHHTLMMPGKDFDSGASFFLRRYVQLMPAKPLYEASAEVLGKLFN